MSGFTPGPWVTDRMAQTVRAADGQMTVCDIRGWGYLTGVGGLHLSEAEAFAVQMANARLIAAAPGMLEALHLAAEALDNYSDVNDGDDGQPVANRAMSALQAVVAAIEKAEGK